MRFARPFPLFAALLATACAVPALAEAPGAAPSLIDTDLAGGLDLRLPKYEVCLDKTACVVDGLSVAAFRLDVTGAWVPAPIYWDPIDGFGVIGSGQNDEIDHDEKLELAFATPVTVSGLWLSDLFVGEAARYGAGQAGKDDAETARADLALADGQTMPLSISGNTALPDVSFNTLIDPSFQQSGDLLSRLIVDETKVAIVAAGSGDLELAGTSGAIDADKAAALGGVEVVKVDNQTLLELVNGAILFPDGTINAEALTTLAAAERDYGDLYLDAVQRRSFGDTSNGEVSSSFDVPVRVTGAVFVGQVGTSNDFSVAGFMVK